MMMTKYLQELSNNPYLTAIKKKSLLLHTLVLVSLFIVVFHYIFDAELSWGGDNMSYLDHAMSLMRGKGYVEPLLGDLDRPYYWYPPGYSAILAIAMVFISTNVVVLKILNGFFLIGALILLGQIIRNKTHSIAFAFASCVYIMCNSDILGFATLLMSEMPYIFFSILTIYLVQIFGKKNSDKFWKSPYFYFIIFTAVISFYIRGVGIILIGAVFGQWILQKKWKQAFSFLGISVALYLPWYIRNYLHGFGNRYTGVIFKKNPLQPDLGMVSTLSDFVDKISVTTYEIVLKGMARAIFPFINYTDVSEAWVITLGIIIIGAIIYGIMRQKTTLKWLLLAYVLGHFAVMMLWDSLHGTRYIMPIIPIVTYCLFFGVFDLFRKSFRLFKINIPYWISYVFVFLCLLQIPKLDSLNRLAAQEISDECKDYKAVAFHAQSLGKVNVVCRKPYIFRWYSECYTTTFPNTLDDKEMMRYLIDKNAHYIVVDALGYSSTSKYLLPIMNKNLDVVKVVFHIKRSHTYLLKFNQQAAKKKYNL